MSRIRLPSIPLAFPAEAHPSVDIDHPETDRFEAATRAYFDRFSMYVDETQRVRMYKAENARLGAWLYPVGRDELVQVGIDFCIWAFAFDDEYCDEGPISGKPALFMQKVVEIQRAMEAPEEPPTTSDRYALAARDMRQRLDRFATPIQVGRFVEGFRTYMMTEMWKALTPKPTLDDYLIMRMFGGGGWAFTVLVHVIAGAHVTQEEYEDRRVRALTEMIAAVVTWDTEPFAYVKEIARMDDGKEHNILRVIIRERQCSFEEAFAIYLDMRWRVLCLFNRLSEEVRKDASPAVHEYIRTLTLFCSGGTVWSQANHRYGSISGMEPDGAFDGGDLIYECPPESFESMGMASCEWWWEHDPARQAMKQATPLRKVA
ncbi:MAG: hypothetical protein U1B84_06375 [Variovorax sp.]|nr:hypothetical protein [Variovorax sp.]